MVALNPFESKIITFTLNEETISFYTTNQKWEAEAGDFKIFVGGSSDKTLDANFEFLKTN